MTDYGRSEFEPERKGRSFPGLMLLILIGFAAGIIAAGWAVMCWDGAAPYLSWMRPPPAAPVAHVAAQPVMVIPPNPALLDRRVAELEDRIDRIARRADAASGDADHAEGLLVAFAARRALDRGLPLGYIENLLRERFGRSQSQAVMTVLATARQPVTLEDLRAQLGGIGSALMGDGPKASWWDGVRRELGALIIVRRQDAPSAVPADRLARAKLELEAGHVDRALAEVSRMPGRDAANDWIAKARRYIAAHNALDLIETSALLDSRPASGESPSPAPGGSGAGT